MIVSLPSFSSKEIDTKHLFQQFGSLSALSITKEETNSSLLDALQLDDLPYKRELSSTFDHSPMINAEMKPNNIIIDKPNSNNKIISRSRLHYEYMEEISGLRKQ